MDELYKCFLISDEDILRLISFSVLSADDDMQSISSIFIIDKPFALRNSFTELVYSIPILQPAAVSTLPTMQSIKGSVLVGP